MNIPLINKKITKSHAFILMISILSSVQVWLLTKQMIYPIVYFLLFVMSYYLFSEFKRHELITYKIIAVISIVIFSYVSFMLNHHQLILYFLTYLIPLFFVYSHENRIFYTALIFNSLMQVFLFTFFQLKPSEISGTYELQNGLFLYSTCFISSQIVILYFYFKISKQEANKSIQENVLTTKTSELSNNLYSLYHSKEKISEIIFHFHQFIYNLENSNAHFFEYIQQLSKENIESKQMEENIYFTQRSLLETAREIRIKLEEEQKKAFTHQKDSNKNLFRSNDEIKQIENIISINNENEDSLNHLIDSTSTIYSLLELIRGISNQINLLSLNAAIEASKTGEGGKGFSVIAKEIKHLQIDVLKTLTDITTEMVSIERYSTSIKDGNRNLEKKIYELLAERTEAKDLHRSINEFIKTYLINNEVSSQKLLVASSDIESSLKRLSNVIESSERVNRETEEAVVNFNIQQKHTAELKKIINELQSELVKISLPHRVKKNEEK